MSRCRDCGAEIRWAITKNKTRMPVDKEPRSDGNVTLTFIGAGGPVLARVLSASEMGELDYTEPRYVSHFATCPNAKERRQR